MRQSQLVEHHRAKPRRKRSARSAHHPLRGPYTPACQGSVPFCCLVAGCPGQNAHSREVGGWATIPSQVRPQRAAPGRSTSSTSGRIGSPSFSWAGFPQF